MEHLDDDTVGALTEGLLVEAEVQALHAHADGCESCRALLAEVGRGMGLVGGKLGRFAVTGQVGAGGMGVVYAAFDPELDRKVALKLVKPEGSGPDGSSRLLREARAAAQLAHPNVVTVYEVGSLGDELFVAMEYIEGGTLTQWLAEAPRSPKEVLAMLVEAGQGLAAAHAVGLVHRDFKPDNVLVGKDGRARVGDFGLARSFSEAAPPVPSYLPQLAETNRVAGGTPAFMAPEQRQGRVADARSDQFSFCLAACEALYGERPSGTTAVPPTRPSLKPKRGVPERARRALARGLSPDPRARFGSMEELLKELRPPRRRRARSWLVAGAVLGVGVAVAVAKVGELRARKQCRASSAEAVRSLWTDARRDAVQRAFAATGSQWATKAATTVGAMLISYGSELSVAYLAACEDLRVNEPESRALYQARLDCLDSNLETARALVELFERADAKVVDRAVSAGESLPVISMCSQPRSQALTATDAQTREQVAGFRKTLGAAWAHRYAGRPTEGLEKAREARAAAKALGDLSSEAKALLFQGYTEDFVGQTQQALRTFQEALPIAQASGDDLKVAEAGLALMYEEGAQLQNPERGHFWDEFVKATQQRVGENLPLEASRMDHLGSLLLQEQRYEEALPLIQKALQTNERLYGEDNPKAQAARSNYAAALFRQERYAESEAVFEQMLRSRERVMGKDHPTLLIGLQNLAMVHLLRHQNEKALEVAQRGVEVAERALGPKSRRTLLGYIGLGRVQSALGQHAQAVATTRRAVEAVADAPEKDPFPGVALLALAEVQLDAKDYPAAAASAEQTIAKLTPVLPDGGEVVGALAILGEAQRGQGRLREARATLTRALKMADGSAGDRMGRAHVRFSLAQVLWESPPERSEALKLAQEALALREKVPEDADKAAEVRAWLAARPR